GADIDLVMTDDGAFHLNVPDNVIIDPAWANTQDAYHDLISPDQVWFVQDAFHAHVTSDPLWWIQEAYHELVDDGPLPATQVYPEDCYHVHTAPELPATQVYPNDCFHLDVVTPTDLTTTTATVLAMSDGGAYHDLVANAGVDIDLAQHFLAMDDSDHVTFSTNIAFVGPLALRPGDGIHEVWAHYNLQLQTEAETDYWGHNNTNEESKGSGGFRTASGNLGPNPSGKVLYVIAIFGINLSRRKWPIVYEVV
ncbi:unnamed protein product, partial [marine sediment metagenome]